MGRILKGIRVKDKNGVAFLVFQRQMTDTSHGRPRTLLRYELETGAAGDFLDPDTFVVADTGEKYSREGNAQS